MLARSFKTATDLGISEVERDALIKVLGMLEREEAVHDPNGHVLDTGGSGFRMNGYLVRTKCGTVGCIAGWAHVFGCGSEPFHFSSKTAALAELCQPPIANYRPITPAQAAHALSNYLTTGEPRWDLALAE